MKEKVTITVSPGGDVKFDAAGFTGGKCIKEIEKLLKGRVEVEDMIKKAEFYEGGDGSKVHESW